MNMSLRSYVEQLRRIDIDSGRTQTCVRCHCRFNHKVINNRSHDSKIDIKKTVTTCTLDYTRSVDTTNNTRACTNNTNPIVNPSCLLARYCSTICMEEDRESHLPICHWIESSIQSCDEIGVIRAHDERASSMSMSEWKEHIRHWHRLTSLLFVETIRSSKNLVTYTTNLNHTSLDLLIHILLRVLLPLKVAPYTALCTILLPKALMLKDDMNACHDFLSMTKLGKISLLHEDWDYTCDYYTYHEERENGGDVHRNRVNIDPSKDMRCASGDSDDRRRHHRLHRLHQHQNKGRVDAPIQSILYDRNQNDHGDIDALLLMDLIIVKYELYTRVISMKELKHCWMKMWMSDDDCTHDRYNTSTSSTTIVAILDAVKPYLGAPDHWNVIHPPILERQCLDLVKLLATTIDPQLIPSLLRRYDLAKRHSLPLLDVSSVMRSGDGNTSTTSSTTTPVAMMSFHRCLTLVHLRRYEHACEFLRDTSLHTNMLSS